MNSDISLCLAKTRKPDVTFHINGRIDITALVAKQLSLSEGDIIDIAKRKGEFLLYRKHKSGEIMGRHEGRLCSTKACKSYCNNLRAYSKRLCDVIFEETGIEAEAVRLPAGLAEETEGLGMALPMITRNPL